MQVDDDFCTKAIAIKQVAVSAYLFVRVRLCESVAKSLISL